MARIRTIKPDFWTDEKIVQLPYLTRLLFVGMWNFADDFGYLSDEPARIKMQIMPSDSIDAESEIDLLISIGLISRFVSNDGFSFLAINHFSDHQKVDHPTKSKIYREASRKIPIPQAIRRELARKYGCMPGETKKCECYYCGTQGTIYWHKTTKGEPSSFVSFSLEIDHLVSENNNGTSTCDNLVLACRECNREKGTKDFTLSFKIIREVSRDLAPEGNGMEGKGKERSKTLAPAKADAMSEAQKTELQEACKATWRKYCDAYFTRYGTEPIRNAGVNSMVKQFVQKLGFADAPFVAEFFVQHNDKFYVQKTHAVTLMNKDAEGLRTQWATGRSMTATRAGQIDKTQANFSVVSEVLEKLEREKNAASS